MHLPIYPTILATLLLSSPALAAKKNPKDAILLSSVKSLTLRGDAKTSHRRVSAIPQLTCKGPGCKHYKIDIMRCVNQGSGYNAEDIEWSCTANVPEEFKLGSTDVICEGYESSSDERVLKGSCGVEYRLLMTGKGEERYGSGGWFSSSSSKKTKGNAQEEGTDLGGYLFGLVFVGVLIWILYSMFTGVRDGPAARRQPRNGGFWGGGWGGGGGGGDPYDPPPPYPGRKPYYGSSGAEGWRPGFWSGALGGAAAGYMAGNRGGRQETREVPRNNGWFGGGNSGGGSGGGSGGWGSPTRGSSSSSSGSGSGARHESTGFGSTSRR